MRTFFVFSIFYAGLGVKPGSGECSRSKNLTHSAAAMYNIFGEYIMLSERELDSISFESSLNRNLRKISAKNIDSAVIDTVLRDLVEYRRFLTDENRYSIIKNISYRIKSKESLLFKFERYKDSDRDLRGILNDLMGIRMIVPDYRQLDNYDYLRKVDMTGGKLRDDGYRGIHFYYLKSPTYYQIEIQVWSEHDAIFNIWAHDYLYKTGNDSLGGLIRNRYDRDELKNADDFNAALETLKGAKSNE